MRRPYLRIVCLLSLPLVAACGTEIDAEQDSAAMAAALAPDPSPPFDDTAASLDVRPVADSRGTSRTPPAARAGEDGMATTLYADNDVDVGARAIGTVRALHAELGDRVEAGATLAELDDAIERAAVAAAAAQLELVRAEHARVALLTEQGGMTTAELEQALYRLRAGQAAYDDAVARLEQRSVRAPFAGRVSRRFVHLGEFVEEGDPLFRVTAMRPLRALVRVPELAADRVRIGAAVSLRALDGREIAGRVARMSPAIDPASGTIEVIIDVPDPDGLRPGATVAARFAGE